MHSNVCVQDVILFITKVIFCKATHTQTYTLLGKVTDGATDTTMKDLEWVGGGGGGESVPVPCQAAGERGAKALRHD